MIRDMMKQTNTIDYGEIMDSNEQDPSEVVLEGVIVEEETLPINENTPRESVPTSFGGDFASNQRESLNHLQGMASAINQPKAETADDLAKNIANLDSLIKGMSARFSK